MATAASYLVEALNLLGSLGSGSTSNLRTQALGHLKEALGHLKTEVEKLEQDRAALKKLQEERALWQATKRAQQRLQLAFERLHDTADGDDAVAFVFGEGSSEIAVRCSRALVSKWSPAIEAVVRHGDGDLPKQIRLDGTTGSVFQAVRDFMCSGRLCLESVDLEDSGNPVLEFADRYGLQELKDEYVALVEEKKPLEPETAAWHLKFATRGNITTLRDRALSLLASRIQEDAAQEQFRLLDAEFASMVLEHHDLQLPGGRESETLRLVKIWIGDNETRMPIVGRLMQSVRFSLLGFMELTELREEVTSNALLENAREELFAAIQLGMEEKFGDGLVESGSLRAASAKVCSPESSRTATLKRKATVLVEGPEEERLGKVLRVARAMYSAVDSPWMAREESATKKTVEEAVAKKADEEVAAKKASEEAAAKKNAEEAVAKKTDEEAAAKKASEEAVAKKAAEEGGVKRADDEAAAKKARQEAFAKKTAEGARGPGEKCEGSEVSRTAGA